MEGTALPQVMSLLSGSSGQAVNPEAGEAVQVIAHTPVSRYGAA